MVLDKVGVRGLVAAIREMAVLLGQMGGAAQQPTAGQRTSHPVLGQLIKRFEAINRTLEQADGASLTKAQLRSIARNFAAIAQAVEKEAAHR